MVRLGASHEQYSAVCSLFPPHAAITEDKNRAPFSGRVHAASSIQQTLVYTVVSVEIRYNTLYTSKEYKNILTREIIIHTKGNNCFAQTHNHHFKSYITAKDKWLLFLKGDNNLHENCMFMYQ